MVRDSRNVLYRYSAIPTTMELLQEQRKCQIHLVFDILPDSRGEPCETSATPITIELFLDQ